MAEVRIPMTGRTTSSPSPHVHRVDAMTEIRIFPVEEIDPDKGMTPALCVEVDIDTNIIKALPSAAVWGSWGTYAARVDIDDRWSNDARGDYVVWTLAHGPSETVHPDWERIRSELAKRAEQLLEASRRLKKARRKVKGPDRHHVRAATLDTQLEVESILKDLDWTNAKTPASQ